MRKHNDESEADKTEPPRQHLQKALRTCIACLVVLTLVDACHRNERQDKERPIVAAAVSQPPPPAVEIPSASAVSTNLSAAVAVFKSEKLVACVDIEVATELISWLLRNAPTKNILDAGMTAQAIVDNEVKGSCEGENSMIAAALEKRSKGASLALLPKGNAEAIPTNCKAQFSGRTVTSRCNVTFDIFETVRQKFDAGSGYTSLTVQHYDFASDDAFLRGCLAAKGTWWELAKDSHEYTHAHASELLKRATEDLNK